MVDEYVNKQDIDLTLFSCCERSWVWARRLGSSSGALARNQEPSHGGAGDEDGDDGADDTRRDAPEATVPSAGPPPRSWRGNGVAGGEEDSAAVACDPRLRRTFGGDADGGYGSNGGGGGDGGGGSDGAHQPAGQEEVATRLSGAAGATFGRGREGTRRLVADSDDDDDDAVAAAAAHRQCNPCHEARVITSGTCVTDLRRFRRRRRRRAPRHGWLTVRPRRLWSRLSTPPKPAKVAGVVRRWCRGRPRRSYPAATRRRATALKPPPFDAKYPQRGKIQTRLGAPARQGRKRCKLYVKEDKLSFFMYTYVQAEWILFLVTFNLNGKFDHLNVQLMIFYHT